MILLIRRAVSHLFRGSWIYIQAILFLGALLPHAAQAIGNEPPYVLEILKHSQTLNVLRGDHVERTFYVSVGRGGDGDKRKLGDKLTPTGVYRIVDFND
ncbi:MAG: L,D-transpeptidase, partial [Saprospiraceae bacterium]|nr:L,D-transpeptidase [Saprospiraceae bacterium]